MRVGGDPAESSTHRIVGNDNAAYLGGSSPPSGATFRRQEMKIDGHEVEVTFERDEGHTTEPVSNIHTIQFVKTPAGRQKKLLVLEETVLSYSGRISSVEINMSSVDNKDTRRKLISYLLRGPRLDIPLHDVTLGILENKDLARVRILYVDFD